MPETASVPEPAKEPAWIPPTIHLDSRDAENLLPGGLPGMDEEIEIKAKVIGIEKGTDRDYDTGEKKPRQSVRLEIISVGEEAGEEEEEMEGVMSDEEEEATLGYKRPKTQGGEVPFAGPMV